MGYGDLNSGSQARIANTFNYWAISPALEFLDVKVLHVTPNVLLIYLTSSF